MLSQTPVSDPYLQTALDAAERAASIHSQKLDSPQDIEYKDRRDLVTSVDRDAERAISETITERFPDHVVLGEESGQTKESSHRWIVDPLDGTTNYCHGIPHYGVSIAYELDDSIEVGVVHHTPTEDTYVAVRNKGAYRNNTELSVSMTGTVAESLVGTGFSPGTRTDEELLDVLQSIVENSHGVRRLGSATTELVSVANGTLDGYFRTGLSPWDTAAAILLIEEAGGTVTDFEGTAAARRETILATNGRIHDELERSIQRHNAV